MKIITPEKTTRWIRAVLLPGSALAVPATANAGFSRPLHDLPDQLGTGVFAIDADWSLFGVLGLLVVVGLLAAFHRRDREE